jgi:glycosyltransferase involved in cell wall biosynthesis
MRVLYLTKRLAEVPGEEGMVHEISKLGVRMSVLVAGGRWRGTSNDARKLIPEGYELSVRDCLFTGMNSVRVRSHLYYYPKISRLIGREKWDLVHIEDDAYNLATFQVVKGCAKHGKPAVFRAQKSSMASYPIPFNFFERYVYKNAVGAIVGNREALNVLRGKGFGKPAVCIQDGTNPAVFRKLDASDLREKLELKAAFVMGFVGQIVQRKGLDTLLKALALLPKECALVLVGTGLDVSKFKSLAQELSVSARVKWIPWVDHREVLRYMCAFDAFLLPSRTAKTWREDFGRVLIEAMACETPVVGSDSGEIPNVIGDAGLIFHEGDERELAGHLRRLMDDPSLRQSLGRRGRQRVLERFTYAKVAAQTVAFYKRICNGSN